MKCSKCQRRLRPDAVACLCGWTAAGESARSERPPCCFAGCGVPALARVFTDTGWANVCVEHYPQIKTKPYIQRSPVVEEVLAAYRKSKAYRDKNPFIDGEVVREPGVDDEALADVR